MRTTLHIPVLFTVLLVFLLTGSCVRNNSQTERQLDRARHLMNEHPDSSLALLRSIPRSLLTGRELRAEHALLYSMALDKNYIDLKSDSIISVAMRWYREHGSADDRLKAYFYQGRIYMNSSEPESAIESFRNAERFADDAEDLRAVAILYHWTANIYMANYDKRSIEYFIKCGETHLKAGNFGRYVRARLNITVALDRLAPYVDISPYDTLTTLGILKEIEPLVPQLSDDDATTYYLQMMDVLRKSSDTASLRCLLREYMERYKDDPVQTRWLNIVLNSISLEDYDMAREALANYKLYNLTSRTHFDSDSYAERRYYHHCAFLYEKTGEYDKMMKSYRRYLALRDSVLLEKHLADTRFTSERIALEESHEQIKQRVLMCVLVIVVAIISVSVLVSRIKAARRRKADIRKSIDKYSVTVQDMERKLSMEKGRSLPGDSVRKRLQVLDGMIARSLIGADCTEKIEEMLHDKERFMQDTYATIIEMYPRTVSRLRDLHLDEQELKICALYMTGLRGRSVASYIGTRANNEAVASIRKKLGLGDGDPSIGNYLRSMLKEE